MEASFVTMCPRCGAEVPPSFRFCGTCGQPMGAVPAYPPYPIFPPPRKDNTALIIVIVVVLLVAIPTVLAGVLYIMVSGLLVPGPPSKPVVTLFSMNVTSAGATILVAGAQPATQASLFRINLEVGMEYGTAESLPTPAGTVGGIVVGSATYGVEWVNPGGSGKLQPGDEFEIIFPAGSGAPLAGTTITFFLIWQDGSLISQVPFSTPGGKPVMSLTVSNLSKGADVLVAGVTRSYAPTNYQVDLENVSSTTFGTAVYMPTISGTSVTVFVGTGMSQTVFSVTWENPSGNGLVSPGDRFIIDATSGAYAPGTTFSFYVLWNDGSTIASVTWQV